MNRYIVAVILVLSMVWINTSNAETVVVDKPHLHELMTVSYPYLWSGINPDRVLPTSMGYDEGGKGLKGIAGCKKNADGAHPWKSKVFILYIDKGRWAEDVEIIKYTDSLLVVRNVGTNKIAMILLNSNMQIVLQEVGYIER